jgi:hypothetical protein
VNEKRNSHKFTVCAVVKNKTLETDDEIEIFFSEDPLSSKNFMMSII